MKPERRDLEQDKLCVVIWMPFIKNCQKAFIPSINITVDEQLMPYKARCKFIQCMSNKPDKFGKKFWMVNICFVIFLIWEKGTLEEMASVCYGCYDIDDISVQKRLQLHLSQLFYIT